MVASALLLDCGNTACKYQIEEEAGWLASPEALLDLIARHTPDSILIATVSRLGARFCEVLAEAGHAYKKFKVKPDWQGLALAYAQPDRLGIDRWLTLVALSGLGRSVIIIDAGTALTIDALDANNRHLGGYILPGLRVMRRALVDDTFALPPVDQDGSIAPGESTADGIANGSILALAGAVEKAATQYPFQRPDIVWTGGDADRIRLFTALPGEFRPSLVFEGMRRLMKDADYMEQLA